VTILDGGGGIENVGFEFDKGDMLGRNEVLAWGIDGYRPVCRRILGGPIICGEFVAEEEALLWEIGTEYGAGPGIGALRRGRLGSGESLNQQSAQGHKQQENTYRFVRSEASPMATVTTSFSSVDLKQQQQLRRIFPRQKRQTRTNQDVQSN
jgi:hypothetical protein